MKKYIIGLLKNLFRKSVSIFAIIDSSSKVSKKAKIYRAAKLSGSSVGDYSYVSPGSELTNAKVGKFCSIGRDCKLGLPKHKMHNISTSPVFTRKNNAAKAKWASKDFEEETPVLTIGNDVWIGSNAIAMSGLKIADGAIIGAGAVVTKDVPPYAIVAGVPARIIKHRFPEDIISLLEESKWWDAPEAFLKKHIEAFQHSADKAEIEGLIKEMRKLK